MNSGLLIYNEIDCDKNKGYIKWLMEEGEKYNLLLTLVKVNEATKYSEINRDGVSFVINRSRFWWISKCFEESGIRVFNNSEFCEVGNDKLKGYNLINSLGLEFSRIFSEPCNSSPKIISKPRRGHGGEGIEILEDLPKTLNNDMIYQEFIKDNIGDVRFYIINNKVVHSVLRTPMNGSEISNFTKGGGVKIFNPSKENLVEINKILNRITIDFGGIDFLLLKDGRLLFNEFEDAVGSRMLSHLGINDTTELFLTHIENELK